MSYRTRLIIILTSLLISVIGITSFLLVTGTRAALYEQANRTALRISSILAQSASFGQQQANDTENLIGELMIGQAKITSAYIAAAEKSGESPTDIINRLKAIVNTTVLDEFWITDEKGHAYLTTVPNIDFTFSPDPVVQPQAHVFWPLLENKSTVVQKATRREIDNQIFKYVGVSGIDKPRIVELGINVGFLEKLSKRMGVDAIIQNLVGVGDVNSIRVFNKDADLLAQSSIVSLETPQSLSESDLQNIKNVIASGENRSFFSKDMITVYAPVKNDSGTFGATIVELSTRRLNEILKRQEIWALYAILASLLSSVLISVVIAHRTTAPLHKLGLAAKSMEQGLYRSDVLKNTQRRTDEFGLLAISFDKMAQEVIGREERLAELVEERTKDLRAAHQRIDDELKTAQSFQRTILPQNVHQTQNFEIFGVMLPAKEMSGDFYDYFMLDDKRLFFVIADVAGKGIPAALFMMLARTALLTVSAEDGDPSHMMARLNEILIKNNPIDIFITILLGIYDITTGEISYTNGGHLLPKVLRVNSTVETLPPCGGLALGILSEQRYITSKLILNPGDTFFLYTDGITEAFDSEGQQFGEARLDHALCEKKFSNPEDLSVHVLKTVATFRYGEQADDTTALILRRSKNG